MVAIVRILPSSPTLSSPISSQWALLAPLINKGTIEAPTPAKKINNLELLARNGLPLLNAVYLISQ